MDNVEQPKPAPEEGRKGAWERFRSKFRRENPNSIINSENTQRRTQADQERIGELQDFFADEATPQPRWADKEVSLNSINLRELPIGWQSLTNLGRAINEMKDDPFERRDLADIKLPPDVYPALPMVASVIANKRNPAIPVVLPTQTEVKAMKPWLNTVERFIGRFSQNWARKFGGYIESRGHQVVVDVGSRIGAIAEQVRTIESPRQQFITETTNLYNHLARPEYEMVGDFFGEHREEVKIEDKVHNLLLGLRYMRDGGKHQLYTRDQYPLLNTVLPIIKFPPDTLDDDQASVAGAELMEGIHIFLKQQGVTHLMPAPKAQEVNLFDLGSWMRGIAETFFGEKLERIKRGLPNVLTQVYGVLPSSGPQLSDKIYGIAENICVLTVQGQATEKIARHLFVR